MKEDLHDLAIGAERRDEGMISIAMLKKTHDVRELRGTFFTLTRHAPAKVPLRHQICRFITFISPIKNA